MNWLKLIELLTPILIDAIRRATEKPPKGLAFGQAGAIQEGAKKVMAAKLKKALALVED